MRIMAHPFLKMFDKALAKSTAEINAVYGVAEMFREKGYRPQEIYDVLTALHKSLIDETEAAVVHEALTEFSQYVDQDGHGE